MLQRCAVLREETNGVISRSGRTPAEASVRIGRDGLARKHDDARSFLSAVKPSVNYKAGMGWNTGESNNHSG